MGKSSCRLWPKSDKDKGDTNNLRLLWKPQNIVQLWTTIWSMAVAESWKRNPNYPTCITENYECNIFWVWESSAHKSKARIRIPIRDMTMRLELSSLRYPGCPLKNTATLIRFHSIQLSWAFILHDESFGYADGVDKNRKNPSTGNENDL